MVDFFTSWSSAQPDASIIKSWYLTNSDADDNPFELIELNDRIRDQLTSIKKKLPQTVDKNKIIKSLKAYYKNQPEKQQKSDLIYLNFLYEAQTLVEERIELNLDAEYLKFMPQIAEHFKPEILKLLEFDKNLHAANIFTELVTIDVIQNLDKESIQEQEKADASLKFAYESRLESLYTKMIIKMIEQRQTLSQGWQDMSTVINYLNQYPFRLLNKEGIQVPENFYLSAANYIKKQGAAAATKFLEFFTIIDKIRSNKTGYQEKSDFIAAFDDGATSLRSINFREDFDYLNSLNVKGYQLNRAFWRALDKKLIGSKQQVSSYLKSAQTSKTIEDFYATLKSAGLDIQKIKEEADRIGGLCQVKPQKVEEQDQEMQDQDKDQDQMQEQPLTFTASEYNQLGFKGAKVMMKIDNKFLAVTNSKAAAIVGKITHSKKRKEVDSKERRIMYYDYDETKTLGLINNIAKDTDPNKVKRETYLACFYNQAFFDKEELENFLQVNYNSDVIELQRKFKKSLSNMDVDDEVDALRRVIGASRKKGPMSGIPREKIINHVEFVYVDVQNFTDMITCIFDVCSMTKENIVEFIQEVTTKKNPTFYNIYYSLEEPREEEDVEMLSWNKGEQYQDQEQDQEEQDQEQDQEEELLDRIEEYNNILEDRQQQITDRLTQLKDEEKQRLLQEKDDDLSHLDAIAAKEKEAADKLDAVKEEAAKQLKEAQAELDKQKKIKTKNDAYLKYIKSKATKDLDVAQQKFEDEITSRMDRINTMDEEIKLREEIIKKFADKKRGYEKGIQFGKIKELEKIIVEAQLKLTTGKYSNVEEAKAHVAELKTLLDNVKSTASLGQPPVAEANAALKQNLLDYNLASANAALATVKNVYYGDTDEDEEGEYSDNKFVSIAAQKKQSADAAFKTLVENYESVNNYLCMFYNKYTKDKDVHFFNDAQFSEKQIEDIFKVKGLYDLAAPANHAEQVKILVETDGPLKDQAKTLADNFKTTLSDLTGKLNTLAKKEEEAKELRQSQTCPQGYEKMENWCFNEKLLEKLSEGYAKIKIKQQTNSEQERLKKQLATATAAAATAAAAAATASAQATASATASSQGQEQEQQATAAAAAAAAQEAERIAAELKQTPFERKQARNAEKAAAKAERAAAAAAAKAAKSSQKPKFELTPEQTAALFTKRVEQARDSVPAILDNIAQKLFKSSRRKSPLTLDEIRQQITTNYQTPISKWAQKAVKALEEFKKMPTAISPPYNKLYKKAKKLQEPINSTVKYEDDSVLNAIINAGAVEIDMDKANALLQEMEASIDELKAQIPLPSEEAVNGTF